MKLLNCTLLKLLFHLTINSVLKKINLAKFISFFVNHLFIKHVVVIVK